MNDDEWMNGWMMMMMNDNMIMNEWMNGWINE